MPEQAEECVLPVGVLVFVVVVENVFDALCFDLGIPAVVVGVGDPDVIVEPGGHGSVVFGPLDEDAEGAHLCLDRDEIKIAVIFAPVAVDSEMIGLEIGERLDAVPATISNS